MHRGASGTNPRGELLDHTGRKIRTFAEGETLTISLTELLDAAGIAGLDQGRKRVIQRRFNVGVLEAISERKASTL